VWSMGERMKRREFLKVMLGCAIVPFVSVPKDVIGLPPEVMATQKEIRDGFLEDLAERMSDEIMYNGQPMTATEILKRRGLIKDNTSLYEIRWSKDGILT